MEILNANLAKILPSSDEQQWIGGGQGSRMSYVVGTFLTIGVHP